MNDKQSVTVLSTPCILTDKAHLYDDITLHCRSHCDPVGTLSIDFTNVHIVAMRSMDSEFLLQTSSVDWFVSDSQILSWSISLLGGENHTRVYGPEFMAFFFEQENSNLRHFFLGGSQECLERLCENLRQQQPGLIVAGSRNGYFDSLDEESILQEINLSRPDVVWVGLGTPKQQNWIHHHKHLLTAKAILAVGFAFDVNAGTKQDAPGWLGPIGLTWLYRLIKEPRRLWKRYLLYNTVFLYRLTKQLLSNHKPNSTS